MNCRLLLAIVFACSIMSSLYAGSAAQDYRAGVDTIALGKSLTDTSISCEKFIENFKAFAEASTKLMFDSEPIGALDDRDIEREVSAYFTYSIENVFEQLGSNIEPNLIRCEHLTSEIADLIY